MVNTIHMGRKSAYESQEQINAIEGSANDQGAGFGVKPTVPRLLRRPGKSFVWRYDAPHPALEHQRICANRISIWTPFNQIIDSFIKTRDMLLEWN
jgi:hypothetical protein